MKFSLDWIFFKLKSPSPVLRSCTETCFIADAMLKRYFPQYAVHQDLTLATTIIDTYTEPLEDEVRTAQRRIQKSKDHRDTTNS